MAAHLSRCAASPQILTLLQAAGRDELAFQIAIDDVVLYGQMDRMVYLEHPDAGQGWVVVDYKTEHLAGSVAEATAGHVNQIGAYLLAATQLVEHPVLYGALVFTEPGEVSTVPPDGRAIRDLIGQARTLAASSWDGALAAARTAPRNCESCPFRGGLCPGTQETSG